MNFNFFYERMGHQSLSKLVLVNGQAHTQNLEKFDSNGKFQAERRAKCPNLVRNAIFLIKFTVKTLLPHFEWTISLFHFIALPLVNIAKSSFWVL